MMLWADHDLSAWGWVAMVAGMVIFWGLLVEYRRRLAAPSSAGQVVNRP